ncbi:DUF1778 domain-containing protein [Pseudomonas chlororaphis]|nr:DUF1778 domain-containing protein [Pseudomonas chlororaphis]
MIQKTRAPEPTKEKPAFIMQADIKKQNLIDIAAALSGRDRTCFILEAACQKAEEVILEQLLFVLDENAFNSFEQALESSPRPRNRCLQTLLARPKRWS